MHILVVPSWYHTPNNPIRGIFFKEQAQALHAAGHQVGVLVPPSPVLTWNGLRELRRYAGRGNNTQITHEDGLLTYRIPYWGWQASLILSHRKQVVERVYKQYCDDHGTPDVIHAHSLRYAGYAVAGLKHHGIPLVITEHMGFFIQGRYSPQGHSYLVESLKKFDAILTVSEAMQHALQPFAPQREIQVVGNMVDTELFRPNPVQMPNRCFTFAIIGGLTPNKHVDHVLRALASVIQSGVEAELEIGGDGVEREKLHQLAHQLGIHEQIRFHGAATRQQVSEIVQGVDCVVSASSHESFGINLIEAMACGKPVIASRSGGPQSFVDKTNGILFDVGDQAGLITAMQTMLEQIDTYDPTIIRENITRQYSQAAVVARLEAVYTTVLATQ